MPEQQKPLMSREGHVGTLVSPGDETTTPAESPRLSVAEARRRAWLGLEQDEILGGRFRIVELIQSGGMGDVYRAVDLVEQRDVAVKTLRAGGMGVRRFEREAYHLSTLEHPGIPSYIAHDLKAEQGPYIVMEWLNGCTLADRLRQDRVGISFALSLMKKVADAVSCAHEKGLIHRDINPSNIFLVNGRLDDVKVLDFGVARMMSEELPLTAEGTQIGTPGYMAPEQIEGAQDIGEAADVFALGCVLYELSTGQRAFAAPTIRELLNRILAGNPEPPSVLNPQILPELEALILACLEKNPSLRPKDAAAFFLRLEDIPEHEDVSPEASRASRTAVSVQQVTSVIVLRGADVGLIEKVRQVGLPFGLRIHAGTDGTIAASTQGKGTASDHAVMAARCALSIQRATRVPTIAVATGLFLQNGEVPSGRAFDSALVSLLLKDRRVESSAGPSLWLDENTASLLDSRFEVRQVEQGFLLRGLRETHEPSRTVLGRRTRCVGRKRELSMLQATLSESFEDAVASSVLVTGPPGVGKTRLANELVRLARRDRTKLEVLRGNGESLTSGAPLGVISQAILRACHIKDDDPHALRVRKVKQRLSRSVAEAELLRVSGFICELLGISTDEFDSPELRVARRDPVLRGDQIYRAVQDWLRAECKTTSILFILDDFQWGDLASVKMVDSLLRNLAEAPLVVVCLARPEVHELFPKLWVRRGVTELRLGGVSRRAATQMIEEILGEDVPDAVIDRVIQRAQGNPFWIEELLRAEKAGQGESVPDRVVLLAQSRIEQLTPMERRILEAGSVFGRRFSAAGLESVLPPNTNRAQIKDALRELVDAEVLLKRDSRTQGEELLYEFSSGLLRDAAYSLISGDEREEAHCKAAEYLENAGEGERLAIALHFSLGGALDRARPHYLGAAEQALSGDDMGNAVACAEEGLSCGAQGSEAARLHLIHAEASKWRGDHATALASARKAAEHSEADSEVWFRAVAEAAVAAGKLGQRTLAFELGKQLLASTLGRDLDDSRIALSRVATQVSLMGNLQLAGDLVSAAEISPGSFEPDPRVLGFLEEARAVFAGASGDPIGRVVYADAGVQHFELAGDHRNACFLRLSQGFAEVEFGENERAITSLAEAVRVAERMGLENSIPVGQAQWGRALGRLGRHEEAEKLIEQAASTFDRQKNVRLAGMCRIYLAEQALVLGDTATAEDALRRAVAIHENVPPMRRIGYALLAALYAAQGRSEEAAQQAELALSGLTSTSRLPVGETLVRLGAAEGLLANGQVERAKGILLEEKSRVLALDEQVRTSHLLDENTEALSEHFLRGCPERAFLTTIALEDWEQGRAWFVHFLANDRSSMEAQPKEKVDLRDATRRILDEVLLETRLDVVHDRIAAGYEALGQAFQAEVDRNNASFASWASLVSKGGARALRDDVLASHARGLLATSNGRLVDLGPLARAIVRVLGVRRDVQGAALEALRLVAARIATSKRKVFEEVAPLVAQFLAGLDLDASTRDGFTERLRAGTIEQGGQDSLKEAFAAWWEGYQATAPSTKAQLILLGNAHLVLYEQKRLERHLKQALEMSVQDLFDGTLVRLVPLWKMRICGGLIRWATRDLVERVKCIWLEVAARFAMKLSLPDGHELDLGARGPGRPDGFPPDLVEITEPRLLAMSQRFDANFGAAHGGADNDWSDLRDRMGYLMEVLRARQQELLTNRDDGLKPSGEA